MRWSISLPPYSFSQDITDTHLRPYRPSSRSQVIIFFYSALLGNENMRWWSTTERASHFRHRVFVVVYRLSFTNISYNQWLQIFFFFFYEWEDGGRREYFPSHSSALYMMVGIYCLSNPKISIERKLCMGRWDIQKMIWYELTPGIHTSLHTTAYDSGERKAVIATSFQNWCQKRQTKRSCIPFDTVPIVKNMFSLTSTIIDNKFKHQNILCCWKTNSIKCKYASIFFINIC